MQIIEKVSKKIKEILDYSWMDDLFLVFLIVCIAFISFSLGIRYEQKRVQEQYPIQIGFNKEALLLWEEYQSLKSSQTSDGFVASKNGTLVYPVNCSGAKRIKEENRVYFGSIEEALSMGYKESTNC